MKFGKFLSLVLGLAIFFAGAYLTNVQRQNQKVPRVSFVPQAQVLSSTSASSGKCQARQIDSTDPQAVLPDINCTPGEIDPAVTQDNIDTTICRSGYTSTVRPSVSYTDSLKVQQIAEYGYADTNPRNFEEDHLISLELGGSPSDPKNLWPEPHPSFNEKDKVENFLHKQVCSGVMTLAEAQREISTNWYILFQGLTNQ